MVAMATSKENPSCSSSSSASVHRHASSLRPPLSPIHHNSLPSSRPPEYSSPASRRPVANLTRALPPYGVKSPTLLPPHLHRNPLLPRSPNPSSVGRKLLRDGEPSSRFRVQKEKERTPVPSLSVKSSCKPVRSKRQTQLFVQQKATLESFSAEKTGAFNHKWLEQTEREKDDKPCRRKWRRFPRESVLRSLRGGDERHQGNILGGMAGIYRDANPIFTGNTNLMEQHGKELLTENACQDLYLDVCAGGKTEDHHVLASNSEAAVHVKEEELQEIIACHIQPLSSCSIDLQCGKTLITSSPLRVDGRAVDFLPLVDVSLTLTPPLDKTLSLTPSTDMNLTPPMQPTQSPDFIKREGTRGILPIDGMCYAAPCALVKDRRKCKPRAVLTVDTGPETMSSAESELGFGLDQSIQQVPTPAVASVEWMLDEKRNITSPSASTDLCRMSFPQLSPSHFEALPEVQAKTAETCRKDDDTVQIGQESILQASLSLTGYEWGALSSQGMFSSCRTETSSAKPRRSIIFNDEHTDGNESKADCLTTRFKPTIVHNALFEEGPDTNLSFSSDDESGDCLLLRQAVPSERSPPFEYSIMSSLKSSKTNHLSGCLPEEVMISMSGPLDSSLSSQDHEFDSKSEAHSITSNRGGSLVCPQGGRNLQKVDFRTFDITAELHQPSNDISSRFAMAKFLCNITATYLDDIATCLGKGATDVESGMTSKIEEVDNLSLEHSSFMAGREKMAECCSLLRGLTLETSKSRGTSSMTSECSVNQPSPSFEVDSADSSLVHAHAGCFIVPPEGKISATRSTGQICSPFSGMNNDTVEANSPLNTMRQCRLRPDSLSAEICIPSRGLFAGAYLAVGLFAISHTYYKHVKQAGRRT